MTDKPMLHTVLLGQHIENSWYPKEVQLWLTGTYTSHMRVRKVWLLLCVRVGQVLILDIR